ncbi:uncharacterized protein [Procambarus clarkii]|uniref:uncharacterized protein n=1 Tax=Procambarus clarkii TaxID=6728 RepID=UPI001E677EEF|nr:uncharacterized protein LOC123767310 [Procambarus clarkii]XP_045612836.1 uncharacterized protein LOC123767310 [Procambarus clarkii]
METTLKTSPYSLCKVKRGRQPQTEQGIDGECRGCCRTLSERLFASGVTNCLTDLTVTFAKGQSIRKVHRLLLGLSSPVFEAMLYGPMAVGDVLHLPEDDPVAFQWMLNYLYFDRRDLSSTLAPQVYQLAHKYFLCDLHKLCTKILLENINPVNFPKIYDLAILTENEALLSQCQLVLRQTDAVLSSPTFGFLSRIALGSLLQEASFEPTSDVLLYKAIVTWGRHKVAVGASRKVETQRPLKKVFIKACNETEFSRKEVVFAIETDVSEEQEATHLETKIPEKLGTEILETQTECNILRHEIEEFLPMVRFLTMTTDEFTQIVLPSGVFNNDESIAILLKIKGVPGSCLPAVAPCESLHRHLNKQETLEVLLVEVQEGPKAKPPPGTRRTNRTLVFRNRMDERRFRLGEVMWKY